MFYFYIRVIILTNNLLQMRPNLQREKILDFVNISLHQSEALQLHIHNNLKE